MLAATAVRLAVPSRILVDQLDLTIAAGECWAVLGPNGAGKSSLLHALAGLRRVDSGAITLDGRPIDQRPRRDVARRIGILLQEETESFWGTVLEYALLGRMPHERALFGTDSADEEVARAALVEVDLGTRLAQPYRSLSGGERQRARLAQLLTQAPDVWLLDEPLTHLDLGHQLAVMRLVRTLIGSGRTVVMAMHEPLWAARVCAHALLLYDSGGFRLGPAQEVLTREHLEALYRCRLEPAASGSLPLFLPDLS